MYEEPAICGERGAGTVFFSGCNLGCVFCQNSVISRKSVGKEFNERELAELFLTVASSGVSSLDLVTPTHFTPTVAAALALVKDKLSIPVVWNSGGYESIESLSLLRGLVDVYLPDFKYYSSEISAKYSHAADYRERAEEALSFMYDMLGAADIDNDGMMKKGIIVRHLVLPGHTDDSKKVLRWLWENFGDKIWISIMNQYTPLPHVAKIPALNRRVTAEEYDKVVNFALCLGITNAFIQEGETAEESFIPTFDYEGV
jgi:putative pyruvate formate lyase activating enzyme